VLGSQKRDGTNFFQLIDILVSEDIVLVKLVWNLFAKGRKKKGDKPRFDRIFLQIDLNARA